MNRNRTEEIMYVNNPSSKILERIKRITIQTPGFNKHLKATDDFLGSQNDQPTLNKIIPRWYTIYENIKSDDKAINEFLYRKFGFRYIYLSSKHEKRKHNNFALYNSNIYSCMYLLKLCIALKSWLDLNKYNVVIVEINEEYPDDVCMLLECFATLLCNKDSSLLCLDNLMLKSSVVSLNTISRYKKYFTKLLMMKNSSEKNITVLHQVIISNYPTVNSHNAFKVILQIHKGSSLLLEISEQENTDIIYKDSFYIVLTNINLQVTDDLVLSLFFDDLKVFEFPFCGYYYEQGLFRYKKDDLLTKHMHKYSNDFKLDLIFLDTNNKENVISKLPKSDFIDGIRTLSEMMQNEGKIESYKKLLSNGCNDVLANFCSKLNYTEDEFVTLINELEAEGHNLTSKPVVCNDTKKESPSFAIKQEPPATYTDKKEYKQTYVIPNCCDINRIEIITDDTKHKVTNTKPKIRPSFKKKVSSSISNAAMNIQSIRPLHLSFISSVSNTVFENLDIDLSLDIEKFTTNFCIKTKDKPTEKDKVEMVSTTIDSKRLFLVSLAIRYLDKKNINAENVYELLITNVKNFTIHDLKNLEKIFPTYEEAYSLATADVKTLTVEEKYMLQFSKLTEANKLVKLFLFERMFFEEIFILEELLEKFKHTFDKLLNSQELRFVLKILLDVGNLINYNYSARRKKCIGFTLSSIHLFFEYKGMNNYTLHRYIVEFLESKNISNVLRNDFKNLSTLSKEQLIKIKEKINFFILRYTENIEIYMSLENDKTFVKKLLIFIRDKLEYIKQLYGICVDKSMLIKVMFGENEKKNINDILDNLAYLIDQLTQNDVCIDST